MFLVKDLEWAWYRKDGLFISWRTCAEHRGVRPLIADSRGYSGRDKSL